MSDSTLTAEKIDGDSPSPFLQGSPATTSTESSSDKDSGPRYGTRTTHDVVLNKFPRTNGRVYEKDIKDMFSMLIIGLGLKASKPKKFISISKTFPYSFDCNTAIEKMKDLNINIELSRTINHISYQLSPEVSLSLLTRFYSAKFLHSPADRTSHELVGNMVLQPTPKGLAIVQAFCERSGMKKSNLPEILKSNFNSMELFCFERDWKSDKILYSKYLLDLLFSSLMGPKPNVWSSNNEQDPLPTNSRVENHRFSIPEFQTAKEYEDVPGFSFIQFQTGNNDPSQPTSPVNNNSKTNGDAEVSPFYHRYFTNPESDAHVHYYVSLVGVRLFKDKVFHSQKDKKLVVDYSMSGKAVCQWLLDCTDILNVKQALDIAGLMVKNNLIKEIVPDNSSSKGNFSNSRNRHYTITDLGLQVCQWSKPAKLRIERPSGSKQSVKATTLDDILKDPGMRLQFRKHLSREYCLENLEAYMQLKYFDQTLHDYDTLLKYVHERGCKKDLMTLEKIIKRLLSLRKSCFSLANSIYITYLSDEAPFIVNIAYKFKASITGIFTNINREEEDDDLNWKQIDVSEMQTRTLTPFLQSHDQAIKLLSDISIVFTQVSQHLHRLMEVDSLPKFLKTISKKNH
ncbi:Protein SST2 [Spathaspora sp. JA1]|nr:Protein SST2 [Spathaspora sp. JA1]